MDKKLRVSILLAGLALPLALASCDSGNGGGGSSSVPGTGDSSSDHGGEATGENTGVYSFIDSGVDKKTEILGQLEKYAVDNMITGLPLYENGGTVMYARRVVKGTEDYVTGYGFGILREGYLNGSLETVTESGAAGTTASVDKPTYYHTWEATDPANINALDSDNSQISDLYSYLGSSYFGNKLNAEANGYDWYGSLSLDDRPIIINAETGEPYATQDSTTTSTTFRIHVRTGEAGGVQFRTGSSLANRKAFDKKYVTIDDYVNAFKILLCGKFGYYRGNELATQTGYLAISGAGSYYNATKSVNPDSDEAAAAWAGVGIKTGTDSTGEYLQFTLGAPTTRFYAMYSLSSDLYMPINMDFFKLVTNNFEDFDNYGGYDATKTTGPVDNILSVGPYYLESWESESSICFARNDEWWERVANANIYRIPGVHIKVLSGYASDNTLPFKEFLAGHLDAASIPTTYLATYRNHPLTTTTKGDSTFKLNVNSCTQETWEKLFGENGSVSATPKADYYTCKPWMGNQNFLKGLFYSIDRNTYAQNRGVIASTDYFASSYMSDPENGVPYDSTEEHQAAVEDFWGSSLETGGYSVTLANNAFNAAIDELEAAGKLPSDGKLTINITWMYQYQIASYGDEIAEYMQTAFNNSSKAKAKGLTLTVTQDAVANWSDVYYKVLMVGQFDLAFGAISGNALDPLNFMECLRSDNSSGFTLNWGADTGVAGGIKYDADGDGEEEDWSFDMLWSAADHGVVAYKGEELAPIELTKSSRVENADGTVTFSTTFATGKEVVAADPSAKAQAIANDDDYQVEIEEFEVSDSETNAISYISEGEDGWVITDYVGSDNVNYGISAYLKEWKVEDDEELGTKLTFTLTAAGLELIKDAKYGSGLFTVDAYVVQSLNGVTYETSKRASFAFELNEATADSSSENATIASNFVGSANAAL